MIFPGSHSLYFGSAVSILENLHIAQFLGDSPFLCTGISDFVLVRSTPDKKS
jgi:hypothetical protein